MRNYITNKTMRLTIGCLCMVTLLAILPNCSGKGAKNKYGTTQKNFKNKRAPRENEFIKNGGYKIKIPENSFVSSKEAMEVYSKDAKNSLNDVPSTPQELSTTSKETSLPKGN